MVPGTLEVGDGNSRFIPPLGVDALVAIMPYEGYTYEDGLVVSSPFSEKLRIPDGTHTQTAVFHYNVPKTRRTLEEPCFN
jgi:DNA-directed RNA polymerase beta subunit